MRGEIGKDEIERDAKEVGQGETGRGKWLGKKGYRFDRCPVALGGLEWTDMGPRLALGRAEAA